MVYYHIVLLVWPRASSNVAFVLTQFHILRGCCGLAAGMVYVIITNLANIVYKRRKAQFIIILTKITYNMITNVSLIILLYSFIGKY